MSTKRFQVVAATLLMALALSVSGALAEGEFEASERQFFLRGEGCGATEALYLSTTTGPDGYDGCGGIGGVPFNEIFHQSGQADPAKTFASINGMPAIVDASRDITGQIRGETWTGTPGGVGQVVVDVNIYGINTANKMVALGSASEETIATPQNTGVNVEFTIDVPDAAEGVELKDLVIEAAVRGVNLNNSNLGLEGDSHFTLPILLPVETPQE